MKLLFPEVEVTKLLSNLIKSGLVTFDGQKKRIIDSDKRTSLFHPLILNQLQQIHANESEEFIEEIKAQALEEEIKEEKKDKKEEAKKIIQEAKAQAETILAQAYSEAESIEQEARKAGEESGYQEGKQRAELEISQQKAKLTEQAQQLEENYRQEIAQMEPKFVELVIRLIENLTGIVIEDKKEVIFYLIHHAMLGIERSKNFLVHVSKEDYNFVLSKKEELIANLEKDIEFDIIEDKTLEKNQCIIEADSKVIDCSLDIKLNGLLEDLKLLGQFGK